MWFSVDSEEFLRKFRQSKLLPSFPVLKPSRKIQTNPPPEANRSKPSNINPHVSIPSRHKLLESTKKTQKKKRRGLSGLACIGEFLEKEGVVLDPRGIEVIGLSTDAIDQHVLEKCALEKPTALEPERNCKEKEIARVSRHDQM